MLERLLRPKSIAVIGGSNETSKPGGLILTNILRCNYSGKLMIVNPKTAVVQGIPAVGSIPELPEVPELAYIAIPARFVRQSLLELAEKGCRTVIILSAGFGELSSDGKAEEMRLKQIADEYNMLMLGPNCLGVMSTKLGGKFAGIMPLMDESGVDFVSGSGATVDYLAEQATKRGLAFNSFMTVGNSAQTGVTGLMGLLDAAQGETDSKVKLIYMEETGDPRELILHAQNLAAKGCYLAGIKAGASEAGNRAAASHTGAMVSNDTAVQAMFDKAGIIRVKSRLELLDVACILRLGKDRFDGRKVCIVTDAGGPGVMLADELSRQGIDTPLLRQSTQDRLTEALLPSAGVGNPVDCLPARTARHFSDIFRIISEEEADTIDYMMVMIGDSGLSDISTIFDVIAKAMDELPIPVFPSFCTAVSSAVALNEFTAKGKCYFEDEVSMARALGNVVNRPRIADTAIDLHGYDREKLHEIIDGEAGVLAPATVEKILSAAGIKQPGQQSAFSRKDLRVIADNIPFPWVMKVQGPLHKTDVGGVKTGIMSLEEAENTFDRLLNIPDAEGVLVQQMVHGIEVILGAKREEPFGSLTAFGLGGIYAEALQDVQFRLAPVAGAEARAMVESLKAVQIIKGARGEQGMDMDILTDQIMRVSMLAADFPRISELDINPLKGSGSMLYAVDARIICD